MAQLTLQMQCDEVTESDMPGEASGFCYGDEDCVVRINNEAAENGYDQEPGPLTWLNSAKIVADVDEDAVHCVVSVGDPRGGFCFTVRRLPDGRIVIHTPYPEEGMAHVATAQLHIGTLILVHTDDKGKPDPSKPVDFSDPKPENDDDDDESDDDDSEE